MLQKAANQGVAVAQSNLGVLYYEGKSVRQDYAKAKELLQKAANQGVADAQFNLGVMYGQGKGVRRDYAKAKELVGKSCDNGLKKGCDAYRVLN